MINPKVLSPTFKKIPSPHFGGGKYYQPFIGKRTRLAFKRASEAETYAKRVYARWVRLYDAAVIALTVAEEA